MDNKPNDMKKFLYIVESNFFPEEPIEPTVIEEEPKQMVPKFVFDLCEELIFKLRSYEDYYGSDNPDYSRGYEEGYQSAADMIENMVKKFSEAQN